VKRKLLNRLSKKMKKGYDVEAAAGNTETSEMLPMVSDIEFSPADFDDVQESGLSKRANLYEKVTRYTFHQNIANT
jgi:hypothetical protein